MKIKDTTTTINAEIVARSATYFQVRAFSFDGERINTHNFSVHQADCQEMGLGKLVIAKSVLIANNATSCEVEAPTAIIEDDYWNHKNCDSCGEYTFTEEFEGEDFCPDCLAYEIENA